MFARLDADKDGRISRDEFLAGRPANHPGGQPDRAAQLFDRLDGDKNGSLSKEELASPRGFRGSR